MDMVGHQNVSVELKVVSLSVMFYSLQVGGAVFVVPESILALVAAGNDMIECSLKFNPRLACHSANLYRKPTISQYSGLTLNTRGSAAQQSSGHLQVHGRGIRK